jgi:hypothetical protein
MSHNGKGSVIIAEKYLTLWVPVSFQNVFPPGPVIFAQTIRPTFCFQMVKKLPDSVPSESSIVPQRFNNSFV